MGASSPFALFVRAGGMDMPMTDSLLLAPGERWFVVQTLAKREAKAQFQLVQQGFASFCPWSCGQCVTRGRTRNVKGGGFPGYLFIALDLQRDRWRSVNGTFGVSRLVTAAICFRSQSPRDLSKLWLIIATRQAFVGSTAILSPARRFASSAARWPRRLAS